MPPPKKMKMGDKDGTKSKKQMAQKYGQEVGQGHAGKIAEKGCLLAHSFRKKSGPAFLTAKTDHAADGLTNSSTAISG